MDPTHQKWSCPACTFLNYESVYSCDICGTQKGTHTRNKAIRSQLDLFTELQHRRKKRRAPKTNVYTRLQKLEIDHSDDLDISDVVDEQGHLVIIVSSDFPFPESKITLKYQKH